MTAKVYWNSQYQKYHARIYLGKGKYFHVGRFEEKEVAQRKANELLARLEKRWD